VFFLFKPVQALTDNPATWFRRWWNIIRIWTWQTFFICTKPERFIFSKRRINVFGETVATVKHTGFSFDTYAGRLVEGKIFAVGVLERLIK